MLTALFADIHANREALAACLADAERAGADRYVFLGDLVGYGPDPVWVVERVAALVGDGALAIQGNHDAAAAAEADTLAPLARRAMAWTRERLDAQHRAFLASLPLDLHEDDRLYVHGSASAPEDWIYLLGPREAYHCFRATAQRVTFCGHTHVPARAGGWPADVAAGAAALDRRAGGGRPAARPQPGGLLRPVRNPIESTDLCQGAVRR